MALKAGRVGVAPSEVDSRGKVNPSEITIPVASSSTLGGVKPVAKTSGMSQDVGVDSEGKLYTSPGSSGGVSKIYYKDFTSVSTVDSAAKIYATSDPVTVNGYTPISVQLKQLDGYVYGGCLVEKTSGSIYAYGIATAGSYNAIDFRVFYVANADITAIPT